MSQELIFLAFNVWELYLSLKIGYSEEHEFFKISRESSKKFLASSGEKLELKSLRSQGANEKHLNEFLLNFCVRILAITEGYFAEALPF